MLRTLADPAHPGMPPSSPPQAASNIQYPSFRNAAPQSVRAEKYRGSQAQWHTLVTSALRRLRQKNGKLKARPDSKVRPCLRTQRAHRSKSRPPGFCTLLVSLPWSAPLLTPPPRGEDISPMVSPVCSLTESSVPTQESPVSHCLPQPSIKPH